MAPSSRELRDLTRRLFAGEIDRRTFLTRSAQLGISGAAALSLAGLNPKQGFARSTRELDALAPTYDYVVVGAGSAGAALAGRLSEDPAITVLLLEAGSAPKLADIAVPQAWPALTEAKAYIWPYETEPQAAFDGARRPLPRGKTLGGTSAINGMLFARGHPADYAAWAEAAGEAWSWESLLPVFRSLEDYAGGATPLRGIGGAVKVSRPTGETRHPAAAAFIEAMAGMGHRRKAQMNDTEVNGVGWSDLTIQVQDRAKGKTRRCSSAVAYLEPAMSRPNLTVVTEAPLLRLAFSASRCDGVIYLHAGRPARIRAQREVILSAGAIDTPRLLMLSGIGAAKDLRAHGLPVIADLPAVGAELQEHVMLESLVYAARRPVPPSLWNHVEASAFWRSSLAAGPQPDLCGFFVSAPYVAPNKPGAGAALPENAVSVAPAVMNCRSRGRVFLKSADPSQPPGIDPAYLSDPRDLALLLEATQTLREAMTRPEWRDWGLSEVLPGDRIDGVRELTAFLRRAAGPCCHPAGTCRMGEDDASVVDPELRVRGVEGLRLADASIMPLLPSAPPNAACLMIGEMAARLLLTRPI